MGAVTIDVVGQREMGCWLVGLISQVGGLREAIRALEPEATAAFASAALELLDAHISQSALAHLLADAREPLAREQPQAIRAALLQGFTVTGGTGGGGTIDHLLLCGNDGAVGDGWLNGGASSLRSSVIDELEELGYWGDPVTATYTRTTSISGEGNITDEPVYDCGELTGDLSAFWAADDPFADLGDPASDPDPDGSVTGMGAFFGPHGDDWDLDCDSLGSGPWATAADPDELTPDPTSFTVHVRR